MSSRNKDSLSYIKFIAFIDIIIKNSDEKNPMSVKDIQEKIYELDYDFNIDYRLMKNYAEYYNEFYEDDIIIVEKKGRNIYFYYRSTSLDTMEAKAIVDLVYSSDFFTQQTKENYKKRIQDMFSIHYQAYFNKILNPKIEKNENDNVFYRELEIITQAIQQKKKIRFTYEKPSLIEHTIKQQELAPIDTVFSNNEYYLLCQGNRNNEDCIPYRMDYIKDVEIVEDSSFSYTENELQHFLDKLMNMTYMYSQGKEEYIELEFDKNIYSNMIDKFGKNIKPHKVNDDTYRIQVRNTINSTFYSWIIGFGGKIQIVGNQEQVKRFKEFLTSQFIDK